MRNVGSGCSRADARRNRALVLQAARSAFEERGLGVPLGEIARRAGVGAGTVYRHFPSKEALFRASIEDRLRLFTDTARDLADAEDPGGVFFRFLAAVVRLASRNKALCDALEAAGSAAEAACGSGDGGRGRGREGEAPPGIEQEFEEAWGVLLVRAQEAGAVREDVRLEDVRVLLIGCMTMERQRSGAGAEGETPGRMTALLCDGLRPGRAVTKLPNVAEARNETRGVGTTGDETRRAGPHGDEARREAIPCEVCGRPVEAARTGRPARYCGGACRQKAHRERVRAPRP
ncbi:helix-turn-helix domain-containing protein [Streptomyces sp. Pv4-95]|uniref:TetR/AcrR family transcriptional regulator n=1 Tax=Streptomyces sp. Pv4-95 TaxID=3049543 RepID=UPI00389287B8